MKTRKLLAFSLLGIGLTLGACTVEQTEKGSLPDVDVSGGKAPEFDVDPANVQISTDTQKVVTPDVDVSAPK